MKGEKLLWFSHLSLKHKLQGVIMATVSIALLLVCTLMFASEVATRHSDMKEGLQVLAQMIGQSSVAALSFGDQDSARQLLQELESRPGIVCAGLYSADGHVFAVYTRGGTPAVPTHPGQAGGEFRDGNLTLFRPVFWNGQKARHGLYKVRPG